MANFAQKPRLDDLLLGIDQMRCTFALGANLHHSLVLSRGIEHRLALANVPADRLLAVNVRTRFDCRDSLQRVPMIG